MGLFNFIKEAGAKLMGSTAQAATSDSLTKEATSHGLDMTKLKIDVNGAKVKLSGSSMTQEQAEKVILALGNTVGVAEVDTSELKIEKAAPESQMYTVVKGDTLSAIAEKFYGKGNGGRYSEIVRANTPPVKNPDLIQPGWVLRIPAAAAA
jgi:nucleoid-associated protein YgaU